VFGPGIGECIVAHVGDGNWIVVDSCINRESGQPIALDYLRSVQVDVASQVKLVIATHWHDDHIGGLAKVLRAAESARFVDSIAYSPARIVRVVELGAKTTASASATSEYEGIFEVLKERREKGERLEAVGPIHAVANRRLLALTGPTRSVESEVIALSPSDGVFNLAEAEISSALSAVEQRRRPPRQGPNQLCVVLWLKVGVLNVILGADLEHVAGVTEGWRAIVGSSARPGGRAGFFKVPHHGSINADCPECWTELLLENPIAIVTPHSPSRLPRPEDIDRLCARTRQVFLTSDPKRYPIPRRDNAIEKTLRESVGKRRRALTGKMGHVQLRADARDGTQEPVIVLKNDARRQCA
jgi:hypothetical protein